MARNSKAAAEVEAQVDKALEQLDPTLAEALRAQFQTLKDEIAQLTSIVGDIGRTGAEALRTGAAGAQAAAGETFADAKARVAGTGEELAAYTRQNPAQAMGIAAGVGLLVGLLLARR